MNKLERFKSIDTFVFDIDGVFTSGNLLVTEEGELLRTMNVKDGYAVKRAVEAGYRVVVITGGSSMGVVKRLNGLGITDIYYGTHEKLEAYREYFAKHDLQESNVLYMGDDIPDLEVMRIVGLPCCPSDAVPEIKEVCYYLSPYKGGRGCVRDVIEKVMKLQGKW